MRNPLAGSAASDAEDRELVCQAQGGNREALEQLITRHQRWIYNIVLRMVYLPQDVSSLGLVGATTGTTLRHPSVMHRLIISGTCDRILPHFSVSS